MSMKICFGTLDMHESSHSFRAFV